MNVMTATIGVRTFLRRLIGAATLDAATYEELESDRQATAQASAIVVLSSLAAGTDVGELLRTSAWRQHLDCCASSALCRA